MNIEHSPLMNEFIAFWFETRVDGELRYETMLEFIHGEWYTNTTFGDQSIVLRGKLNSTSSEYDMIAEVKPLIESAIRSGQI